MSAPTCHNQVLTLQDLSREITTGGRAKQVMLQPGDILGDLRILREVDPPEGCEKAGRWFAVQCDCGEVFVRLASKILWAARRTDTPCCRACRKRLRKLHYEMLSDEIRLQRRTTFYNTGSLYTPRALEKIEEEIMEALEREIAPRRDTEVERVTRWGFWVDPTRHESASSDAAHAAREREIEERHLSLRAYEAARVKNRAVHKALGQYVAKHENPPESHDERVPVRPTKAPLPTGPTGPTEVDASFFDKTVAAGTFWSEPCPCGSQKLYARCHGRHQPCPCFSGVRFALCHGLAATPKNTSAGSGSK